MSYDSAQNPLTIDECAEMLQVISSDDRDTWRRVGTGLKDYLGEDGLQVFDSWSQASQKYNRKVLLQQWKSFKPGKISIATVRQLAQENGWRRKVVSIHEQPPPAAPAAPPAPPAAPQESSSTQPYAIQLWGRFNKAWPDTWTEKKVIHHPYAIAKGIETEGGAIRGIASGSRIGQHADVIIVPIRENGDGDVMAVECINADGMKQTFGSKSGHYLLLGNTLDKSIPWYVAEGWASGWSAVFVMPNKDGSKVDNCACAIAFGKANMRPCAEQVAKYHAPNKIHILGEQDQ